MNIHEQQKRSFQSITDKKNIDYILHQYIIKNKLYIVQDEEVHAIENATLKDHYLLLTLPQHYADQDAKVIHIHSMTQRYIELTLRLVNTFDKNKKLYEVTHINIATTERDTPRIQVINHSLRMQNLQLAASNDKIIALSDSSVAIEVILEKFQQSLMKTYNNVQVLLFKNKNDTISKAIQHSKKIIAVERIKHKCCFQNAAHCLSEEDPGAQEVLTQCAIELEKLNARHLILYPVLLTQHRHTVYAYAYFKLWYTDDESVVLEELLPTLHMRSRKLIISIKRVLAQDCEYNPQILNISNSGALLLSKNQNLNQDIRHGVELFFEIYAPQYRNLDPLLITSTIVHHSKSLDSMHVGIAFTFHDQEDVHSTKQRLDEYLDITHANKQTE